MDYYDVAYFEREAVVGTTLLAYERDKITEFHQWLGARKMQVISHEIELRFKRVTVSNGLAHATVTESMGFCWVYLDKPDQPIATGLGTDHEVDLVLKNGQWLIRRDDYLDPFRQWLKTDHRTPRG